MNKFLKYILPLIVISIFVVGCATKEKTRAVVIKNKKRNYEPIVLQDTPNANLFQVKKETLMLLTHKNSKNHYRFYDLNSKELIYSQMAGKHYLNAILINNRVFGYNNTDNKITFVDIKSKKVLKNVTSSNFIGFDKRFESENFFIIIEISDTDTKLHLYDKKTLKRFSFINLKKENYLYNHFKNITYPSFSSDNKYFKFFVDEEHYAVNLKTKKLYQLPYNEYRNFLNSQTEGLINQNSLFYSIHIPKSPLDFAILDFTTKETKIYHMDFGTYIFGGYFDEDSFWTINAISRRLDRISIFNTKTGFEDEIIHLKQPNTKSISIEIDTYSPNIYPLFTKNRDFLLFCWKKKYHDLYKIEGDYTKQQYSRYLTIYDIKKRKYLLNDEMKQNINIHSIISTDKSFILLQSYVNDLNKPINFFVKVIWVDV